MQPHNVVHFGKRWTVSALTYVGRHLEDGGRGIETQSDISWRVSVKAIKQIMPFEPLISMAA